MASISSAPLQPNTQTQGAAPKASPQTRPNLLEMARQITDHKQQWEVGEIIYLLGDRHSGGVYLRNQDCFIALRMTGFRRSIIIQFLDLINGVWRYPRNLATDYQDWASEAKTWVALGRRP